MREECRVRVRAVTGGQVADSMSTKILHTPIHHIHAAFGGEFGKEVIQSFVDFEPPSGQVVADAGLTGGRVGLQVLDDQFSGADMVRLVLRAIAAGVTTTP